MAAPATMGERLRRIWHGFRATAKSKLLVPDYRQIQQEVDTAKLFLLTSFHRLDPGASDSDIERIVELGRSTPNAQQQQQVQANVHEQVRKLAGAMDNIFLPWSNRRRPLLEELSRKPSGLSFAVSKRRHDVEVQKLLGPPETASLTEHDIATALRNQIGFSLHLRPSEGGQEAGDGVFLDGIARTGSVVALYPGIVYSPSKYRYIPGYPKIAEGNPYLISRYEGSVIDGKPWGRGGRGREWWNGLEEEEELEGEQEVGAEAMQEKQEDSTELVAVDEEDEEDDQPPGSRLKIELIERRNPLALAHFVNHPPKGKLPNVMVCPYDFPEFEEAMRPYIPNLRFEDDTKLKMQRKGNKWVPLETPIRPLAPQEREPTVLRGLVLVATRYISNEELLLNYRLSHPESRPAWYHPVDEEEDKRRWAIQ